MPILATFIIIAAVGGLAERAPEQPQPSEFIEFLGFSANGAVAAWLTRVVVARQSGITDTFTIATTQDTRTGETIATFRAGKLERVAVDGTTVRVSRRSLLRQNPRYRAAEPQHLWQKILRATAFKAEEVAMEYKGIRLRPDADARMSGRNRSERMDLVGAPGTPVGYQVMVRTIDSKKRSVCHLRVEASAHGAIEAQLRAYRSRSGRTLALLGVFAVPGADDLRVTSKLVVVRLDKPLATAQQPAIDSGVVGIEEAYANYLGDWGRGVRVNAKHPTEIGPLLGRSDARRRYSEYMQMLGN